VAQVFATAGVSVRLVGRDRASLDRASPGIRESLRRFADHGLVEAPAMARILARLQLTTALDDAGADLVVEAVLEDQALKLANFELLDQICPRPAVLASSSGRPVSRLAERVRRRNRPGPLRLATPRAWRPSVLRSGFRHLRCVGS
jgi:3-hydroxyacyl-CoA dehydrogenase